MFCGAGHAAAAAAVEKAREALLLLLLVGRVGESHEPRSVRVACPEPRRAGVRAEEEIARAVVGGVKAGEIG